MDFLTQQFIATAANLKRSARDVGEKLDALESKLSTLADRLKDVKESIDKHQKSEAESTRTKPISVTDFRTDAPIRVETNTKKGKPEWVWSILKGTLEVGVAVAIILYTGVAYVNWQESIDATNFSGRQAKYSRESLNAVINNFRIDQRAWLGVKSVDGNINTDPTKESVVTANAINSGKSPGLDVRVAFETDCEPLGKHPVFKYTERTSVDREVVMPNQEVHMVSRAKGMCSPENFKLLLDNKAVIFVAGTIWYRDTFHILHSTDYCYFMTETGLKAGNVGPDACNYHNDAN